MGTDFKLIKNTGKDSRDLNLTSFYGGDEKGLMLQITQGFGYDNDEPGFIQLTERDAHQIVTSLTEWLKFNFHKA